MLKKLYKHEFLSLLRWLLFVWIGVIVLAVLNRGSTALLSFFTDKYSSVAVEGAMSYKYLIRALRALSGSMTVVYILGAVAAFCISFGLVVVRFYKNLFTTEGYFSFSIPVKPTQHVWCKLICGTVMIIASLVVIFISLTINFIATDFGSDVVTVFLEMNKALDLIEKFHVTLFIIETVVISLLTIMVSILMFYCSISFGQSFKNKIGGSVISYVIINIILNAVSAFVSVFVTLGSFIFSGVGPVNIDPIWILHIAFYVGIAIQLGLGAAYFAITAYRTTKKLNLE